MRPSELATEGSRHEADGGGPQAPGTRWGAGGLEERFSKPVGPAPSPTRRTFANGVITGQAQRGRVGEQIVPRGRRKGH